MIGNHTRREWLRSTVPFHGNNTTHLDALSQFIYNGHTDNGVPGGTGSPANPVATF